MSKVDSGVFEETKIKTNEKREAAEAKQQPKPALRAKAGPKQAMTDEEVMAGLGERGSRPGLFTCVFTPLDICCFNILLTYIHLVGPLILIRHPFLQF